MSAWIRIVCVALLLACGAAGWVWWFGARDMGNEPGDVASAQPAGATAGPAAADTVARGAYLARAGNCMLCHTRRGGDSYAGGRAIATPFGTVFSSNLTPDTATGIGAWTSADFWRALHHGRSRDGRLLYPAFPYTSLTQVTRADADAMFAYLRSLPAVAQANQAHQLRWPYDSQAALAVWRALYFRPEPFAPDTARDAAWNRGAYLVRGLGHCNACHNSRNALGAPGGVDLSGGVIPMQNWYAPSLLLPGEAGLGDWSEADIVRLLQTGVAPGASVTGPMAEVVLHSTQYLQQADLAAMASFLRSLPSGAAVVRVGGTPQPASASTSALGAKLYQNHCAQCHGDTGAGVPGAYPALAGNRAVLMADTSNLVQMVVRGGFAPATAGNPRPYGMPPYLFVLGDAEIAAVLSHIRAAWGNQADAVSELDVSRSRAASTP